MNQQMESMIIKEAKYFIENKSTVRETAKHFKVSRSKVHRDLTKQLKNISFDLYIKCKDIIEINIDERSIRGGISTKRTFKLRGYNNGNN